MSHCPPSSIVSWTPAAGEVVATLDQPRAHEQLLAAPRGLRLEAAQGRDQGRSFDLDGTRLTAGRGKGHDIQLSDASVSNTHFELRLLDDGLLLRDLGSSNGTFVGRARLVDGCVKLSPGATFWAGSQKLRVASIQTGRIAVSERGNLGDLLGASRAMRELFALIERLAPTPIEVLIGGETGTGKDKAAQVLHALSQRKGELVVLDCGALPAELADAKILGYAKGAFTGATRDAPGCFEAADGGTIFLDEIGELPVELQPKLLRVLESRQVVRLGEHTPRKVDVRVLAATNRDLPRLVADGGFREDLYHRLASMRITMPPLRDRPEDIAVLAQWFLAEHHRETGRRVELTDEAQVLLLHQRWQGNVRELKATMRRIAYLTPAELVTAAELARHCSEPAFAGGSQSSRGPAIDLERSLKDASEQLLLEFQHHYCRALIDRYGDDLDGAARHAGYSRRGLRELLRRIGLEGRP